MRTHLAFASAAALLCFLWMTLTAGTNAEHLLAGDFRVIAPWIQVVPSALSLLLFSVILFVRSLSTHPTARRPAAPSQPAWASPPPPPPPVDLARVSSRGATLELYNFSWTNLEGIKLARAEIEQFQDFTDRLYHHGHLRDHIDLTPWSQPGPVGPLESLMRWVDAQNAARAASPDGLLPKEAPAPPTSFDI